MLFRVHTVLWAICGQTLHNRDGTASDHNFRDLVSLAGFHSGQSTVYSWPNNIHLIFGVDHREGRGHMNEHVDTFASVDYGLLFIEIRLNKGQLIKKLTKRLL